MAISLLGCMLVKEDSFDDYKRRHMDETLEPIYVSASDENVTLPNFRIALALYGGDIGQSFKVMVTASYPDGQPFSKPVRIIDAVWHAGRFDSQPFTIEVFDYSIPIRQMGVHRLSFLVDGVGVGEAAFVLVAL